MNLELTGRQKEIFELKNDGLSFVDIGKKLCIGRQRASQIYDKAFRLKKSYDEVESLQREGRLNLATPLYQLPVFTVRAANVLEAAGIKNLGELLKLERSKLLRERMCGVVTLRDIEQGLNVLGFKWEKVNEEKFCSKCGKELLK